MDDAELERSSEFAGVPDAFQRLWTPHRMVYIEKNQGPADDTDPFHRVLSEHLPISGAFPELEAWVHRVDALPRA